MGEGEETECLGTPQGVGVNFLKKKIFSFECAKKVEGGRDTRAHRITPAWARARAKSLRQATKCEGERTSVEWKMSGKKLEARVQINKESPVNSTRDGARIMRELLGEREEDPLTHNPQDWGQNPRKLYSDCAQGPVLPTSEGCWRRRAPPLGWSQNQQLAQSAVGCWVRLAAAGPAQQSRRDSLHLRSAGDSRSARSLSGLVWPRQRWAPRAGGEHGRVRGPPLPHFFPRGGVQLRSWALHGLLPAFAARPLRCCERWWPARLPHILAVREEDLG